MVLRMLVICILCCLYLYGRISYVLVGRKIVNDRCQTLAKAFMIQGVAWIITTTPYFGYLAFYERLPRVSGQVSLIMVLSPRFRFPCKIWYSSKSKFYGLGTEKLVIPCKKMYSKRIARSCKILHSSGCFQEF